VRDVAYDIGPKIGIEGEKEFRQAINDINMNLKTLGTEMQAVASQFDKNDNSTKALTARNEVLNKQIEEQKKKLAELQKGLEAASDKYGENDRVTQGWKQAVNKATAELNKMERELEKNKEELSNNTKWADKFNDAIGKMGKGLANIGGTIGKAAIEGVKAVGVASVAAGAAALKLATDVGKTADDLITLSNQTGISAQKLQEWDYAMRFIDVDMDTMTKSMARLVRSMDNANKGSKDVVEAFNKLGVSWKDSAGNMRNNQEVFNDLIDALGKIENETERDALAMRLFGKSAQELNPLIQAGSGELARLSEEAHKVGAVLSDEALASAGQFDDMMQTLEASMKGLTATLGVAILPAVQEVVNSVVAIVPKITEAIKTGNWEEAGQAITDGINSLLEKITGALPELAIIASNIIGGLANSIVVAIPQVLPPLIDATVQLMNTLVQVFIDNGPMLINAGVNAIVMLVNGIVNSLPQIIDAGLKLIMALANSLIDNLPKIIDATIKIISALVDGFLKLLPELIPVAIEMIVTLAKGLIDALPKLIEKVPEIVKTIVAVIIDNLPLLINAAIEIISTLINAMLDNLPLIINGAVEIIAALATGLILAIPQLVAVMPKIIFAIVNAFVEYDWKQLGKNLIEGIWKGINDMGAWLKERITGFVSGIGKTIKEFFGIESPSKLMAEYGRYIAEGLAKGIEDNSKKPEEAVLNMAEIINKAFNKVKENTNLAISIINKELELWELQNKDLEGTAEALNMKLQAQEKQLAILAENIKVTEQALNDIIYEFGESSKQAQEYTQKLLEEKIAYEKLKNEIYETTDALKLETAALAERNRVQKEKATSYQRDFQAAFRSTIQEAQILKQFGYSEKDIFDYATEQAKRIIEPYYQEASEKQKGGNTIINVYNPQPNPIELGRQIQKTQRDLALGY